MAYVKVIDYLGVIGLGITVYLFEKIVQWYKIINWHEY